MEQRTRIEYKNGLFKIGESVTEAHVECKVSNSKARRGNFKVDLELKTQRQVNKISRKVEQQMTRQQLRRMKKMGLA